MDLALVVSIVSICGFAAALSYNVYEFRKVGRALDEGSREHREMLKEHQKMMQALDRINESLAALAESFGAKSRKRK